MCARGWVARGLHTCVACVHLGRYSSWKLPPEIRHSTHLSIGVKSLVAYSLQKPKLCLLSLDASPNIRYGQWQSLSLPCEVGECIKDVMVGLAHTVVLLNTGKVWGYGSNYFGQLGVPSSDALDCIRGLEGSVKQVASGLDHTLYLMEDGRVFSCGFASDGQTGDGSHDNTYQLNEVMLSTKPTSLATCSDSSFALTVEGQVFGWGNNEYGQLGVCSEEPQLALPTLVDTSHMDAAVTDIVPGGAFTAFLTSEGSVFVAGYNNIKKDCSSRCLCAKPLQLVHCGRMNKKVVRLEAGLNYLVGYTSSSTGFIWGKLQLSDDVDKTFHWPSKFVVCCDVHHLTYGPLGLAALTNSPKSKILELI